MKEEVRFYAITSVAVAYPAGLDDFGVCEEICRGIEFSRAPAQSGGDTSEVFGADRLCQVCEEADQVAVFPFKSVFYEVAHSFVINRTKILNPCGIVNFSFFPGRAVLQFVGGVEVALQGSAVFEIVFRGEESV